MKLDRDLYGRLFEAAPDALVVVDEHRRVVAVNAEAERLFGWRRCELVGRALDEVVSLRARGADDRRGGRPPCVEGRLFAHRRNGVAVPVEVRLNAVDAAHRRLVAAAVRDVSTRVATERARHAGDERFRLLVESIQDYAIIFLDRNGFITTWNAGATRVYGFRTDEAIGRHTSILLRPEDVARRLPERLLAEAVERGTVSDEGLRRRKDGSEFWANVAVTALFDENHRLRGFAKVTRDVTRRRRDGEARDAVLRRMRAILDRAPVGIILVDGPRGERIEANRYAEQMLGRTIAPDGGVEQFLGCVLDGDRRPVRRDDLPLVRALRGETIHAGEQYLLVRPDGAEVPVLGSAAPLVDQRQRIEGAVVAFDDASTVKRFERLRDEWIAVVAHDLRQPLHSIVLNAQLLERLGRVPDGVYRGADVILRSARRLNRLVHDLLDLSRLDANRLRLERRRLDVAWVLAQAVERQTSLAPDREMRLVLHGDVGTVEADPDRLDQILDNLLSNAVKYGACDHPVVVDAARRGGELVVSVTNHGAGVSPEQARRLFQRFSTQAGGAHGKESVGLGLYITKGLIEAHGGRIAVESTPGATTTFRFTLPVRPS